MENENNSMLCISVIEKTSSDKIMFSLIGSYISISKLNIKFVIITKKSRFN